MLLNSSELFGTPTCLVMDPVHGGIPFFSHEKEIMDHPLFQRLRHIKQTDVLHFVFPGATHSRLEHCLGTMHVAATIFANMVRNYLCFRNQAGIKKKEIDAIQYCYGCLRIAALLHDAGHLPFSHQFEASTNAKKLLCDPDVVKRVWREEFRDYLPKSPVRIGHEHLSILCALQILGDLQERKGDFPFQTQDIVGMMEKGKSTPSDHFTESALDAIQLLSRVPGMMPSYSRRRIAGAILSLFKDIIAGEIDADKMDYLLRDSYFSGCKYGAYNLDHLSQNICVGYDFRNDPNKPWVGIAINRKGLGALEDFVHSRFRMYLQVYNHKTAVGFKWLLTRAITEILREKHYKEYVKDALSNMREFENLTDTYFWEAFRSYAHRKPSSACAYLIGRRKLVHLDALRDKPAFEKAEKVTELAGEYQCKVLRYESPSHFSNINPKFQRMRVLVKDKSTGRFRLESIVSNSAFFQKFSDTVETHFYRGPEFYDPKKGGF